MKFSESRTTDKCGAHAYGPFYDDLLSNYIDKDINLLELGVLCGGSIIAWHKVLEKAKIFGIDCDFSRLKYLNLNEQNDRIKLFDIKLYMPNTQLIVDEQLKDLTFDIIVDDASHDPNHQFSAFKIFFERLKPQGIYVIEDLREMKNAIIVEQNIKNYTPTSKVELIDLREFKNKLKDDILIKITKDK